MQDFESKYVTTAGTHFQATKAIDPVTYSGSKNGVTLPFSTAISRVVEERGGCQSPISEKEEKRPLKSNGVSSRPVGTSTGKFPKSARLLKSSHYKFLHRNSSRLFGELLFIDIRQGKAAFAKLGITVSRKFGKSHDRNRFKRVVREAYRELYLSLPNDLEMNVTPKKTGIFPTKKSILSELHTLLAKVLRS